MITDRINTNAWAKHSTQSLFRQTCRQMSERIALVEEGISLTYRELLNRTDRLTQALVDGGVGKGDVVSVLPTPTIDFTVVCFAVLQSGATLNPLNLMWGSDELTVVLGRNEPKAVITVGDFKGRDYPSLVRQALDSGDSGSSPELLLVADDEGSGRGDGFTALNDFIAASSAPDVDRIEEIVAAFDPLEPQFICQTSGSTGHSKSPVWNHRSPLSSANFVASNLGLDESDRWLNVSPLFHNSGLCVSLIMGLAYVGLTVYMFEKFDPDTAVRCIRDEGIVGTFGFSAHWAAMGASAEFQKEGFGLKKVLIAGDSALYNTVADLVDDNAVVANLYAQTENGPLVAMTEIGCVDGSVRANTNGRPMPGVEAKVVDIDSGEPLPDGSAGEICYKSPYLFLGYLNSEGDTWRELDDDGFFRSGDFGLMTGGHLRYVERLGGIVKSGGENVSLAKVTAAMTALFAEEFDHVHAVAVRDPYWGDRIVALVNGGVGEWDSAGLRERCKAALAAYEVPRDFVEWSEEWPVSAEGKLDVKRMTRFVRDNLDV